MYWTDWNHLTIEKANKFTGENHRIIWNVTHRPMDIHIFHPLKQKPGRDFLTFIIMFFIFKFFSLIFYVTIDYEDTLWYNSLCVLPDMLSLGATFSTAYFAYVGISMQEVVLIASYKNSNLSD